jgi:peptidoglycan hydrolase-like protein with peptidoglycan-binding domain
MTLTKPDFKAGTSANPNPNAVTDAEWWLWCRLHELEPKTKLGGIVANKPGFHAEGSYLKAQGRDHGQGNRSTDYSIRDAINRKGSWLTHASALDWTFPDAQAGHYATIDKYTSRLLKSALDPKDPRLDMILFEFYGQADSDKAVEGYNEYREEYASSDSSHLWHLHLSFLRSECNDFWGMWALLTVLMGWSVAQWRSSLPAEPKPPVKPKPPAPAGLPVHKLNSRVLENKSPDMRGTDVRIYQAFIGGVPADGVFGDATEKRTREYQRMRGLKVDGVAGPKTLGPIVKALG